MSKDQTHVKIHSRLDSEVVHYAKMGVPVPRLSTSFSELWTPGLEVMKEVGPCSQAVKTSEQRK